MQTNPPTQLWKLADAKAKKSGSCAAIYWVREKKAEEAKITVTKQTHKEKWETGKIYKGDWLNNEKHGYGIQIWSNGNKYEGDWVHGERQGHGMFWVKQGDELCKQYTGSWERDLKQGLGVYFYTDKSRYEGNWLNGLRQGKGTRFFANGDVYVGDWNEGKMSGFGTLTKSNQDIYEGQWLNNKREGPGIYYYKHKEMIYDGEWVNDIPKCGIYCAAHEFFGEEGEADRDEDIPEGEMSAGQRRKAFRLHYRPLPELRLINSEAILAEQIEKIQKDRQAVRNLAFIDLEQLFSEEGLDDLRRIFSHSDAEGAGKVSTLQLRGMFGELGFEVSDVELGQLLIDMDKDAQSKISFSDFVKMTHLVDDMKALKLSQLQEQIEKENIAAMKERSNLNRLKSMQSSNEDD